jgi:stage IV sporulation protein B
MSGMLQWYQKNRKTIAIFYGLVYLVSCYAMLLTYVPKEICMTGNSSELSLAAPVTVEEVYASDVIETEQESGALGAIKKLQCKLFGLFPIATIQVTTVAETTVEAVGQPVGIYMKMSNVYVVGNKELTDVNGYSVNPTEYILKEGDYITAVNGQTITTKEELQEAVTSSQGEELELTVCREQETMQVAVCPVETKAGEYKLGLWVKDDIAGVGTMTYMDGDGNFGALGHGISDSSTGKLIQMDQGYLYQADITDITPSSTGSPGELTGVIAYGTSTRLGTIAENSGEGIFGKVTGRVDIALEKRVYSVGYKQEIQRSNATILFGEAGEVSSYQIVIDKIDYSPKEENKAFVFHVTDSKLIAEMGGIVQGMSGSPIIQNGKIIGAVTHVFVNDPTKGYGIFIEDMLEYTG